MPKRMQDDMARGGVEEKLMIMLTQGGVLKKLISLALKARYALSFQAKYLYF